MKKVLTALAIVAAFGITSCGGPDLCDCVNLRDERKAEIKEAGDDKDKVKEIKEENKAKRENLLIISNMHSQHSFQTAKRIIIN